MDKADELANTEAAPFRESWFVDELNGQKPEGGNQVPPLAFSKASFFVKRQRIEGKISLREASRLVGCSKRTAQRYLWRKRLPSAEFAHGCWWIAPEDAAFLQAKLSKQCANPIAAASEYVKRLCEEFRADG